MIEKIMDGMEIKLSNKTSFSDNYIILIFDIIVEIFKTVVDIFILNMRCYEYSILKASSKLHLYFNCTHLKTISYH